MQKIIYSAGLLLFILQNLIAQDSPITDSLSKQLIISHSKFETSQKSSYKPTILIDKEEIDNQVLDDIGMLLDAQVGINVAGAYSNPGKDKSLFLQGAGGEYTLILIDGVPVTDPSGIGGTFDLRSISLGQIDRIEVVKGAQSALYGSDAVAGVVNLITNSDTDNYEVNTRISYGSYNTRELNSQVIFPFEGGNINLSLGHSGSSGISEALDLSNEDFDKDGYKRYFGDASVNFDIANSLDISLFGRYSDYKGGYDGGAFFDAPDEYNSDWLNSGISVIHTSSNSSTTGTFTLNKTSRIFDSASFGISEFNGIATNTDLYHNRTLNNFIKASIGLNLQNLSMKDENQGNDPSTRIISPYGSLTAIVNDNTQFEVGFRYNDHETFGGNVNWTLGFSHWFTNQIKFHGFYGTSFKAPNLFQLFGQFGANPDLQPQTGRSLNLGLSSYDMGSIEKISLSLFSRSVDNIIVYLFPDGYTNINKQRDFGLETSITSNIGIFRMSLTHEYLFGEEENRIVDMVTENLLRRPKHTLELKTSLNYRKSDLISMGLRHVGAREDLFFDNNTFLTEAVILDAYLFGSIMGEYSVNENAQFQLQVNNLFNADFQEIAGFGTLGINFHIGFNYKL